LNFGAFAYCTSLKKVTIPGNVISVGKSAFLSCSSLTEVVVENGVEYIGDSVFSGCSSLTSILLPDSLTQIGKRTFAECTKLTSITIPNSVRKIGANPFFRCTNLSAFYGKFATAANCALVVDGVFNSFAPASGVTEYNIPNNITAIGAYAFYYCKNITGITIPESVTSIEEYAFYYCRGLTSITIPERVASIEKSAFSYCSGLMEVHCKANTPPTGGESMFAKNASNRKIYVPGASVNTYRATQYWSDYASEIYAEPGTETDPDDEAVAVPEDKYPSKTNFKRRVLVTQFTGTGCGFCPRIVNALYQLKDSSYADKIVLTAAHLFNYDDPAYLSTASNLARTLGITSFPTVCVDLDKSATTGSSYNAIAALIDNAQNRVAVRGGIAVNSKYNAEAATIDINVLVKAKERAEFRVGAWLLEDGIYGVQDNYGYTPNDGVDFNTHNNCVRVANSNNTSSDYTGFSLGTIEAGKSVSRVFSFGLKPNGTGDQDYWNHDNLSVVVFISTKEGDSWHVNNVVKVSKNGSVDFEYLD
jgi:thiol-disulfide isomerase/thioredoxin